MKHTGSALPRQNKHILYIALATAALLLIPLISMQFSDDVRWTPLDFVTAGILLFSAGTAFDLMARKTHAFKRRVIFGAAISLLFLYLWAELAVGIFTHWGS